MADEFPTLEVVLGVCVLWLGWRGWLLARAAYRLESDVERVALGIEKNDAHAVSLLERGVRASLFGPLARAALESEGPSANARVEERAQRTRRRLRSGAGRDLVVCAVLLGALVYARSSNIGVNGWFFALGAAASTLLLVAVAVRLHLERGLGRAVVRLTAAITARRGALDRKRTPKGCRVCGNPAPRIVRSPDELGEYLVALSVTELSICAQCGHVGGRAEAVAGVA